MHDQVFDRDKKDVRVKMKKPDIYPRTFIPKVRRYLPLAGLLTHSLHRPSHAYRTVVEEMVTLKLKGSLQLREQSWIHTRFPFNFFETEKNQMLCKNTVIDPNDRII